ATLADAVTGSLGGKVGVAPRLYVHKLDGGVLDRVDLHREFDARRDYALTVRDAELTPVERNARDAKPDDIHPDLGGEAGHERGQRLARCDGRTARDEAQAVAAPPSRRSTVAVEEGNVASGASRGPSATR